MYILSVYQVCARVFGIMWRKKKDILTPYVFSPDMQGGCMYEWYSVVA